MLVRQTTVTIEKHELPQSQAVALRFFGASESSEHASPTVFVLHGLNSRKERHLDVCLRLAQAGFAACAPDAALHGERTSEQTRHLAIIGTAEFIPAFTHVVRQTVDDIAHFASHWGLQSYGIIGHSMGGFIALHTALADPRARAIVVVGGALDIAPPGVESDPSGDPIRRASELAGRAVLLLHGENDAVVPVTGARKLHAALSPLYESETASRLSFVEIAGGGHEWTDAIADQAVAWMQTHLKAAPKTP